MNPDKLSRDYSHRRVLVADDDESIRNLVTQTVRSRVGCEAECVDSGDAALERLEQEPWDVLITDMVMPGIQGLDLVVAVKKRWPDVEVIVMTGFTESFPYVEVIQAGAADFLGKPYQPQELEAKLLRLFKERDLKERFVMAEAKYRSLFELSVHGALVIHPESHEIVDANRAFCVLVDHERDRVVGTLLYDFMGKNERPRIEQALQIFASGGQGTLSGISLFSSGGDEYSVDMSVTFITVGRERIVFVTFRDLTERRRVEDQLTMAMQIDEVTKLSNKRTLNQRLDGAVMRGHHTHTPVSLLFIDLDNFKRCNDTYGHPVGDQLLKSVGDIIRKTIRHGKGDEGFRYGGDEFAVLLEDTPKEEARRVGERVREAFAQGQRYETTMSMGLVELQPGMEAKDLLAAADTALYAAKAAGKDTLHVG